LTLRSIYKSFRRTLHISLTLFATISCNPKISHPNMPVASGSRARPFVFTFGNTNTNSNQNFYQFDAAVPRQLSPPFLCAASLEDNSLPLDQVPELMNPETHWTSTGQLTPKSVGRVASHHRGSSLSSLGSAGPASPYTQATSNPRIAITDSAVDGFPDITTSDVALYSAATKPLSGDRFYPQYPSYGRVSNRPTDSVFGVSTAQDPRSSRGLLPAPEFPIGNGRSNPVSVASSIASESPATPLLDEPDIERRQKTAFNTAPKLDRTMTDAYDGLYNQDLTITSSSAHTTSTFAFSAPANNGMFAQRLHAANSQHLSAAHSPISTVSSERSPFRHGSPLAPGSSLPVHSGGRYHSIQQVREHQQAEEAAEMLRRQMAPQSHDTEMSTTISPQDSLLEFQEQEGDTNFPLFPSQESHLGGPGLTNGITHTAHGLEPSIASHDSSRFQYLSHTTVPQHYPFVANAPASAPMTGMSTHSYSNVSNPHRPSGTNADGGTYTCTYHGCTLRFESPALLQKHKREGHRQVHGLPGSRRADGSRASAAILNSQAGPHKCERINPSTGKPCNTIFSRPYDLTRHEDTIHNAKKQKVRCNLCTEEKTFSRADALTRHYRVCHPEVELPGKHRKRRGSG
jgi:hypothetical protein